MPILGGIAALLLLGVAVAWWFEVLRRAHSTYRALLRPNLVRDALRAERALVLRFVLWLPSWAHAVNRLAGATPRARMATPAREVWREGSARLVRMTTGRPGGEPVLVVHSLVTRPWILDLLPGRSLVGGLAEAGFDVYLLDWGDPGRADRDRDLDACANVLLDAVRVVADASRSARIHVVGYCTGATLALATVAAHGSRHVASLTLVAPPVDTAVPGGMGDVMRSPGLLPSSALGGRGLVVPWVVRESFHALRRRTVASAYARLRRRGDRDFQAVAGALDRWAWDQRAVPGALFFDLVDLYRGNLLVRGRLRLHGVDADLRSVRVPVLVAVTDRDHIVPIASSLALTRLLRTPPTVVRCPAGHVSMLMGVESRTTLLPAITAFVRGRRV